MHEAKKVQVSQHFGGNCPKNPERQREQKIKEVLTDAVQRKRANKEINVLREQFHYKKSILDLLEVIKRRCSPMALVVAIERVERRRDVFTMDDLVFFEKFKTSLEKTE